MRGNVLDLAIGVILGAAFGKIVTSFTNDVLMPPLGLALGRVDFTNLFINLSGTQYATLAEAKAAGAATINYGIFLNTIARLPDRRLRDLPAHPAGESAEGTRPGAGSAADARMPRVPVDGSGPRSPVLAVHVGAPAADGGHRLGGRAKRARRLTV